MNSKEFNAIVTPGVSTRYGSPMGRNDINKVDIFEITPRVTARRLNMTGCGAYDVGGAYWGCADYRNKVWNMYVVWSKCGKIVKYVRGETEALTLKAVINKYRADQMNPKHESYLDLEWKAEKKS